jgi:hypothetical protein
MAYSMRLIISLRWVRFHESTYLSIKEFPHSDLKPPRRYTKVCRDLKEDVEMDRLQFH